MTFRKTTDRQQQQLTKSFMCFFCSSINSAATITFFPIAYQKQEAGVTREEDPHLHNLFPVLKLTKVGVGRGGEGFSLHDCLIS